MNFKLSLCIATTIIFWASAFIANKICLQQYTPLQLAFLRYLAASIILIAFAFYRKLKLPAKKDMPRIFICGFMGISFYNFTLYNGQLSVSPGTASLLVNTSPLFTTLFSMLILKEKVNTTGWLGLLVSFGGVCIIIFGKNGTFQLDQGALLILAAAISFSLYFVFQKPLLARYSSLEVTTYCLCAGVVWLLPGIYNLPQAIYNASLTTTSIVVYLGIFPGVVAYLTWSVVNSHLRASRSAPFLYLIPVFSIIFSFITFGEVPSILTLSGGIIAIGGIALANSAKKSLLN